MISQLDDMSPNKHYSFLVVSYHILLHHSQRHVTRVTCNSIGIGNHGDLSNHVKLYVYHCCTVLLQIATCVAGSINWKSTINNSLLYIIVLAMTCFWGPLIVSVSAQVWLVSDIRGLQDAQVSWCMLYTCLLVWL